MANKKMYMFTALLISAAHFVLSWISFTRSELIRPNESTETWKALTKALAFPLVYFANAEPALDLFPLLMIGNSLLWGAVLSLMLYQIVRRTRAQR